jgi:glycosyltransferase involved in cell wall biosynthesis
VSKNKKILHINSFYTNSRLHQTLLRHIQEVDGFEQFVYVPLPRPDTDSLFPVESIPKCEVLLSQAYPCVFRKLWPLKIGLVYRNFIHNLKSKGSCNLIHAHTLINNGLPAFLVSRRLGIPFGVTVRNTDINAFITKSWLFRRLAQRILIRASFIIFLSPAYLNQRMPQYFPKQVMEKILPKCHVISNGVSGEWFSGEVGNGLQDLPSEDILRVLFCGRVDINKNLIGLARACGIIANGGRSVILEIVGEGPEKQKVLDADWPFQLIDHGFVQEISQLKQIYRRCQILAVPSFSETFGICYAEALSQGKPIIYSRGEGFDGFFPDGEVGFAVDPLSPEDIAKAIIMVTDKFSGYSSVLRNESLRFSWNAVAKQYCEIYRKHTR